MESPIRFSGAGCREARPVAWCPSARPRVRSHRCGCRGVGQDKASFTSSGRPLKCVALRVVTNVFPASPRVTATGYRGDSRPGLKIPLCVEAASHLERR